MRKELAHKAFGAIKKPAWMDIGFLVETMRSKIKQAEQDGTGSSRALNSWYKYLKYTIETM